MAEAKDRFISAMFARHGHALLRFLRARFRNEEEAADIAQEAWMRLYRLEHPQQLDNAKAFLFQAASNLAVDHLRRVRLENDFAQSSAAEEAGPELERSVDAAEQLSIVEQAISELPVTTRQAFVMHRSRDMSYPEIARALGVSTSMVEKHIITALKHCRRRLQVRSRALPSSRPAPIRDEAKP
ncbi:MAG: RNA polymerase sigma factor [Gammaproteobacteria bacterium]|nr:RNA polymerase sigma factor [Gammaproteobacteria bacterium]